MTINFTILPSARSSSSSVVKPQTQYHFWTVMSANGDTSSTASGSSAAAGKGKKPIGEVTKVVIDRSKIGSFSDAGRKNLLTSISSLLETFSSAEKKDGVVRRFNSLLNHCDYVHERDLKLKERTNKGKAFAVALLVKAGENDKVAEEKVTNYEQQLCYWWSKL